MNKKLIAACVALVLPIAACSDDDNDGDIDVSIPDEITGSDTGIETGTAPGVITGTDTGSGSTVTTMPTVTTAPGGVVTTTAP